MTGSPPWPRTAGAQGGNLDLALLVDGLSGGEGAPVTGEARGQGSSTTRPTSTQTNWCRTT